LSFRIVGLGGFQLVVAFKDICNASARFKQWSTSDILFIAEEALSNAYVPIGATLSRPEISDVIHSQSNKLGSFAHGFTYSVVIQLPVLWP